MEITLEEKIKRVTTVIDEAMTVQKINPVYIPVTYFSTEALGFVNARDIFRILRESKTIKKIEGWWGHDIIGGGKKQRFVKTHQDEPQTDEDYQVFEIKIDSQKWVSGKKLTKSRAVKASAISADLIFDKSGLLYIKNSQQKPERFGADTHRYKILNALIDARGKFVSTEELREISGKATTRDVQKEIGVIKKRVAKLLGIKKPKKDEIIEGVEYSGYRLLIKIRKSK